MKPEFRGFRCAMCQEYIAKAWHHKLDSSEYLVSVHLCENCQKSSNIEGGLFKPFRCDKCAKELTEVYHVWNKENGRLIEIHYCKSCGEEKYGE
jgi:protein-arginine kinase activator protein McsA